MVIEEQVFLCGLADFFDKSKCSREVELFVKSLDEACEYVWVFGFLLQNNGEDHFIEWLEAAGQEKGGDQVSE